MITQGFELVEFTRTQLVHALTQMLPGALKGYNAEDTRNMRAAWSSDNPTRFTCYFVSEMVYWHCALQHERTPMALNVPGDDTLHRYVQLHNGQRIDLTCDQFPFDLNYAGAKRRMFLQTGGVGPSARARQLAALLNLPAWSPR